MANYMLIGAKDLGSTLFTVENGKMTVNLTEDVARKLWDNYYVPFVKGWFAGEGRFRSDDIKTGNVLAYVGSNSSATFFPKQVQVSDTESHEISLKVLPNPSFAGSGEVAVQQGAGMVVTEEHPGGRSRLCHIPQVVHPAGNRTSSLPWAPATCP